MFWHSDNINFGRRGTVALFFSLVCLLLCGIPTQAQNFPTNGRSPRSYTAERDFAIADFDSDRQPDLASVDLQTRSSSGAITYSIRFRMGSGEGQAFGVVAPAGGLQLVAWDVNGDNAPDLLVRTAWQHQRVALFLNDGHGNFTPADPAAFPVAAQDYDLQWNDSQGPLRETTILVRSQNSTSSLTLECAWNSPEAENRFQLARERRVCNRLLRSAVFGRAPPPFILLA